MNTQKKKLSALNYGLGALILLFGCPIAAAILFFGTRDLPRSRFRRSHTFKDWGICRLL